MDSKEMSLPLGKEETLKLDGFYYNHLKLGYNGFIGGLNSSKDFRIIPILLMNYDMSLRGGTVRYTAKERGKFREDLITKSEELFKIKWNHPKCILMTWDEMLPENSHQCNSRHSGRNQFQAALLWEADNTILYTNYEDIQLPKDCSSNKYAMLQESSKEQFSRRP
ncbi:unnamed protein product [Oikopleura dioica]|uniref:Uncharacterized protein n=1 Tax=Oikopleura dioica TaxID=34765 RepID=E4X6N2_OIKDI|nr:unnamed protein product [Oikopleura dioica]